MQDFIKSVNSLPFIVKLLLCIPVVEIFYGICRILNQATKKSVNILLLIVAILTVIPGAAFMWLIDIVWVCWKKHAFLLG